MIEILITSIVSGSLVYLILRPRLKKIQQYNYEIEEKNRKLIDQHITLQNELINLNNKSSDLQFSIENSKIELEKLKNQENIALSKITIAEKQAEEAANIFYQDKLKIAESNFTNSIEKAKSNYEQAINEFEEEFLQTMKEAAKQLEETTTTKKNELSNLNITLDELRKAETAAVESAKRAEEIKQQADFYKLHLTEADLKEIEMLRNITPYLKDKEALNKVIWKVYYEKPTSDLIGRVVGSEIITGIYKITNLINQMCYVGQSTNIADRLKQHIKRGLGAEAPTRNKLYPAMATIGVENFSFELIEKCPKDKLDEREDYWQEFFHAKDFGYSIK